MLPLLQSKIFVGKTPEIELSRADVNGTVAKTNYQATVTAVTPTGTGTKTEACKVKFKKDKSPSLQAMIQFHSLLVRLRYLTMVHL